MEDADFSEQIARILARIWVLHQLPAFAEYAKQTFGCEIQYLVKWDGIYIAEAECGDAPVGNIGGMIKQWWYVNDQGIFQIPRANLPRHRDAPESLRSQFYVTPVIKFLKQGHCIAIGEALGPDMHCRKVGKLAFANEIVAVAELRVIWSSNTI